MSPMRWSVSFMSLAVFAAPAMADYRYADFASPKYPFSNVRGISGNLVYGEYADFGIPNQAGYWPNGAGSTFVNLFQSGYAQVDVLGGDGKQLVGFGTPNFSTARAFLWNVGSTTPIDLTPSGSNFALASGVSKGIQVGATYRDFPGGGHAVRWRGTAASVVDIHPPGYAASGASAIDNDYIVGSVSPTPGVFHAAFWTIDEGTFVDIHPKKGYYYSAAASVSGDEIGGFAIPDGAVNQHAMLWSASGGSVDLNPAGYLFSALNGLNGVYQVGDGSGDAFRAVLWKGSPDSMVDLMQYLPNYTEAQATGINADGVIVGVGNYVDPITHMGVLQSFELTPTVPEPSVSGLLGVASLILLNRWKRDSVRPA